MAVILPMKVMLLTLPIMVMLTMKGLISFFKKYRETSFSKALEVAKEIAMEMDITPQFRTKQRRITQAMNRRKFGPRRLRSNALGKWPNSG
ncbi:hypothetical protein E2562_001531 [Oryza meyeriana var. granulata]|uniref:Uncharacterized protein n=1 Tax=Oryza meyeriana var. granulata TaxID=110450 RepID=A0A6G1DF54_9ORYZ|nr:hypothetical protein E2562_001531 [Oryza meyeriana var. granulata]